MKHVGNLIPKASMPDLRLALLLLILLALLRTFGPQESLRKKQPDPAVEQPRQSAAQAPNHTPATGHTSASLLIQENADPDVQADLERFFARLVPDGDPLFRHDAEGPDDMPAHVRAALTQVHLSVPMQAGALLLGTWQGIHLYEHRHRGHAREIVLQVFGED